MYCLDTSVIIDIFRGNEEVIKEIEKIWTEEIFVTSISLCELYKGAYGHSNFKEKINLIEEFIKNLKVLSLNSNSCKEFGNLSSELKKNGKEVNDFDIIIASIVKSNNLVLVSRDKHFKNFQIKALFV